MKNRDYGIKNKGWLIGGVILAACLGLGYWFFFSASPFPLLPSPNVTPSSSITAGADTSGLTQEYRNATYRFSLRVPAGYTAQELPGAGGAGETVVLSSKNGDGIQIAISPFDEDTGQGYTLTRERILKDLPGLTITQEQPIDIGDNYRGLAFLGDNQAFGGASREAWFVFDGNLYQISTYARLDDLLKAIFATWQFN